MRSVMILALLLSGAALADTTSAEAPGKPGVVQLPITTLYQVTAADGTVQYISGNERFVFVGKMYDLWQGEVMTAGVGASKTINLNRNGVSIEKIAFPVGSSYSDNTLFIAPECEDCRQLLTLALETKRDDLNIVLLASSESGRKENAYVWCSKNRVKGLKTVYLERQRPGTEDINQSCDQLGLMLAEQAALVFGIGQLPLYVDGEGVGHVGESAIYAVSK